jgi:O-antigen/teichoic acid export membrane protein
MSITMVISKIIALGIIYLGYWFCYKYRIWKYENSLDVVQRWSVGLLVLLGGLAILLDNADLFNLPNN